MFTGLIEHVGVVENFSEELFGARLWVRVPGVFDFTAGESVAVNGSCLTVADLEGDRIRFDLSRETLSRISDFGSRVHIERALKMGDRLGGHFVSGHVDGVGQVVGFEEQGECALWKILLPDSMLPYVVEKGSIAIHGISLTIAEVEGSHVTIALIPETLKRTIIKDLDVGSAVNVEADLLSKHVERILNYRSNQILEREITL